MKLQKKDKERKINNENPKLRSKQFLHKVNTIIIIIITVIIIIIIIIIIMTLIQNPQGGSSPVH